MVRGPEPGDFGAVPPETHRQASQIGGAERGGLDGAGAHDRNPQQIGLALHEAVIDGGAAVHAELTQAQPRIGLHGADEVGGLKGNAFQGGAGHNGRRLSRG